MTGPVVASRAMSVGPVVVTAPPEIPDDGGSAGINYREPIPIQGRRFGGGVAGVLAGFRGTALAVTEGATVQITARINRTSDSVVYAMPVVVAGSSTMGSGDYILSATEFLWRPGERDAVINVEIGGNAAAGATTQLDLAFDAAGAVSSEDYSVPLANDQYRPTSFSITARDQTFNPPAFSFATDTITANEGDTVPIGVDLSGFVTSEQVLRVRTVGGTGVADRDYTPLDTTITLDAATTVGTVDLVLPQNAVDAMSDPTVELELSLDSGTATAGDSTSLTVTIRDDDGTDTGVPVVQFRRRQATLDEGSSDTFTAFLLTATDPPLPWAGDDLLEIPVLPGGSLSDFSVSWPGTANRLTFEAGVSEATFDVEARTDTESDPGESITFTIQGSADQSWAVGEANELTVFSREAGTEPTEVFAAPMTTSDGVRVLRQYSIGVDAEGFTLPQYAHGGELAQTVAQRRGPAGEFRQNYVYALDGGERSVPGLGNGHTPTQVAVNPAASVPSESGSFLEDADIPLVSFTLRVGDGGATNTFVAATEALANGSGAPQRVYAWTSPTGRWEQSGADLCRERVFVWRPEISQTGGASGSFLSTPSGEFCGMLELVEQRIAGERDIVLYEGRFYNGAWKQDEGPRAENPFCDGTLNVQDLRVFGPASGWRMEMPDAVASFQTRINDRSFNVLLDRANVYEKRACRGTLFWFVLVRDDGTESAGAAARAAEYADCKHICTTWGGLGRDRKGLSNESADVTLNLARAEFSSASFGASGFEASEAIAEAQLYGTGVDQAGYRSEWVNDTRLPWQRENRLGWFYGTHQVTGGGPGGSGIYGMHNLHGTYAEACRSRYELAGAMNRSAEQFRDIGTDSAPWYWTMVTVEGGEPRLHAQNSSTSRWGSYTHPHLLGPASEVPDANTGHGSGASVAQFRLAPTDRPWNTAPSGQEDPDADEIHTRFTPFPLTHISRVRPAVLTGWIDRRSPMAYRFWEECAARVTRSYSPIRPTDDMLNASDRPASDANLGYLRDGRTGVDPSHIGKGYWFHERSSRAKSSENQRNWGWSINLVCGFFGFATDDVRGALRGQGAAATAGGRNWAEEVVSFFSYVTTPCGLSFLDQNDSDDSSWDESEVGVTDEVARLGAFPRNENTGSPGREGAAQKTFMAAFVNKALHALHVNFGRGLIGGTFYSELFRWVTYLNAGSRAKGRPFNQRWPEYALGGIDDVLFPERTDAGLSRFTAAEQSDAANNWIPTWLDDNAAGAAGEAVVQSVQFQKAAWLADAAEWFFEDETQADEALYVLGADDLTGREQIDRVIGSGLNYIGSTGGESYYVGYQNATYPWSLAARLLNRIT